MPLLVAPDGRRLSKREHDLDMGALRERYTPEALLGCLAQLSGLRPTAEPVTAGELAEHFDISKPSLSHHLATLKNAGLVTDERHGQNIVYSLNTTVMQDLIGWFMGFTNTEGDKDE